MVNDDKRINIGRVDGSDDHGLERSVDLFHAANKVYPLCPQRCDLQQTRSCMQVVINVVINVQQPRSTPLGVG